MKALGGVGGVCVWQYERAEVDVRLYPFILNELCCEQAMTFTRLTMHVGYFILGSRQT